MYKIKLNLHPKLIILTIRWFTLSTNEKKVKGHGWLTGLLRCNDDEEIVIKWKLAPLLIV